jgi:hypothetical protein
MLIDINEYTRTQLKKRGEGDEIIDRDGRLKMYDLKYIYNENNITNCILNKSFLSIENQWIIQNQLKKDILQLSNNKYSIVEQSTHHLTIIMKYILLRYTDEKNINVLNKYVLQYCVPYVYKQAVQYEYYYNNQLNKKNEVSTYSMPADRIYNQLQYSLY